MQHLRPWRLPALLLGLTLVTLLVGLGRYGYWEPQELANADKVTTSVTAGPPNQLGASPGTTADIGPCPKTEPPDALARTLTQKAAVWGQRHLGSMKLPAAGMGVALVICVFGIAALLGSLRAGTWAGLVVLSFPLTVLQARLLMGEMGTATGGAMIVFGALCIAQCQGCAKRWQRLGSGLGGLVLLLCGSLLGYAAGGLLLGVLPALVTTTVLLALLPSSHVSTASQATYPWLPRVLAIGAALACLGLTYVLFRQTYSIVEPLSGSREIFGKSVVAKGCWSEALGGVWKFDDDRRITYEAIFEQIVFGTFPWGCLVPMALAWCWTSASPKQRAGSTLALAWAATAWLATWTFQRKAGFAVWSGFPGVAVVIGLWLDSHFPAPATAAKDALAPAAPRGASSGAAPGAMSIHGLLAGLVAFFALLAVGKDLTKFPDRLASLLVGGEVIKYPTQSGIKLFIFLLGMGLAVTFCGVLVMRRRDTEARRSSPWPWRGLALATAAFALFWAHGWHRGLSQRLSSRQLFATYLDARQPEDELGILGDLGNAPHYYADGQWTKLGARGELLSFLARPSRVFAIAPRADLCAIHKETAGKNYFVVDTSTTRSLLLTNQLGGLSDQNPLAKLVLREEPKHLIAARPAGKVVWDNRIELVGWNLPKSVELGEEFKVTVVFHIKENISGTWKIFAHFDGAMRFQGDHEPIGGQCPTTYWQKGDYIVDVFTVKAGNSAAFSSGTYQAKIGFYTGAAPSWQNMKVSEAPPEIAKPGDDNRVTLAPLTVY